VRGSAPRIRFFHVPERKIQTLIHFSRSFIQTVMSMGKKFPTFAFVVLVLGLLWLAVEMHWIPIPIPWLPLIVVVVAAGWIVNHYAKG